MLGGISLDALGYAPLLTLLGVGAAVAIVLAFVYDKLPKNFIAQSVIATVAYTAATWIVAFPNIGIAFSQKLAIVSVVGSGLYGIMTSFVLHHAIGLALPLVPMARRAEEFSDDPASAHS